MPTFLAHVSASDLLTVGFLFFLEGVLSIDNALVLALIVRPLPKDLQKRALTYGIAGAIVFRTLAISAASWLMHWEWVKLVGGAYLVYLPAKYWVDQRQDEKSEAKARQSQVRAFWTTVLVVELTDMMFALDSILTAVALSRKLWVVVTGGLLGMIAMRFAAGIFLRLLERFPRFEPTAYILVLLVGFKLLAEGLAAELQVEGFRFHDPASLSFWVFWSSMLIAFCSGFLPHKKRAS